MIRIEKYQLVCRRLAQLVTAAFFASLPSSLSAFENIDIRIAVIAIRGTAESSIEPKNMRLAKQICSTARMRCEISPLPIQRAFKELAAGHVDFVLSLEHAPVSGKAEKIVKVSSVNVVVIAKKKLLRCEDFQQLRFVAVRNASYAEKLGNKCGISEITWTNSYTQSMKMYRNARVDGIIGVAHHFIGDADESLRLQVSDVMSSLGSEDVWLFRNPQRPPPAAMAQLMQAVKKI